MGNVGQDEIARRFRPFYVWFLPLIWGCCSLLSYHYPGDEYGLWTRGSIVGVWGLFIARDFDEMGTFLVVIVLSGAFTVAAIGLLMDSLRVNKAVFGCVWIVSASAICAASILAFPTYAKAISKNGSFVAYVLFACNCGVYAGIILSTAANLALRFAKRGRNRCVEQPVG
jgi:hypothetical protein